MRHFKVRICENLIISALTEERIKDDDDAAIKRRLIFPVACLILTISPY